MSFGNGTSRCRQTAGDSLPPSYNFIIIYRLSGEQHNTAARLRAYLDSGARDVPHITHLSNVDHHHGPWRVRRQQELTSPAGRRSCQLSIDYCSVVCQVKIS